ncbi:jupiter microtubule associated homolog 1-like isoform X7 [Oncorhynchus keta]|uniref:jupiter microtubule associated homolog 1-like isoform X6 n=1 Tax=Oncorhynchus keta TaxID=8018 RepID=UPI00227C6206|nr:jupiter microtubule associated homolog 1-like isoform X6 [Oncorhynchus keta]XP_052346330.1 jupiter microtubule associated homolog 1-like isoform X7 [Oncorhynchus keta]
MQCVKWLKWNQVLLYRLAIKSEFTLISGRGYQQVCADFTNGGKPTGVLCGEPSAPLRRCAAQSSSNNHEDSNAGNGDNDMGNADNAVEVVPTPEQRDEAPQPAAGAPQPAAGAPQPAAGMTSGRRNPPGGKSSLILG